MKRWGGARAQRFRLLVLDHYGTTCWLCGKPGADTVDHVVPLQHGGAPFDLGNARPAHSGCNGGRGNRTRHNRRTVVPADRTNATSREW